MGIRTTAHAIQKEIVNVAATLTRNAILEEIEDDLFTLLVDEARDISIKEQMAIVLRFVNKKGCIIERFLGLVHVEDTTPQSLKKAIENILGSNGLSISNIRGQGYDGSSNMREEHNGLKSLILAENKSAYYVHCFAHQLQLTHVGVAKKHDDLHHFFDPSDFSKRERGDLPNELETYIMNMRSDVEFTNLKGIGELLEMMVAKKKDIVYPLVSLLLKLALLLPVVTTTVERVFSVMKLIKTPLRNKMGDVWLNDCLMLFVEDAIFEKIENEDIMKYFRKIKSRRGDM